MDDQQFYRELAVTYVRRREAARHDKDWHWYLVHDDIRDEMFDIEDEIKLHLVAFEEIFGFSLESRWK